MGANAEAPVMAERISARERFMFADVCLFVCLFGGVNCFCEKIEILSSFKQVNIASFLNKSSRSSVIHTDNSL